MANLPSYYHLSQSQIRDLSFHVQIRCVRNRVNSAKDAENAEIGMGLEDSSGVPTNMILLSKDISWQEKIPGPSVVGNAERELEDGLGGEHNVGNCHDDKIIEFLRSHSFLLHSVFFRILSQEPVSTDKNHFFVFTYTNADIKTSGVSSTWRQYNEPWHSKIFQGNTFNAIGKGNRRTDRGTYNDELHERLCREDPHEIMAIVAGVDIDPTR